MTTPALHLNTRALVEAYLSRLNREAPAARRDIVRWGDAGQDSLMLHAVSMPQRYADLGAFLGESRTTFAMQIEAVREAPMELPYSVGILLNGAMKIRSVDGERIARAGEGVIVDPSHVEHTWLEPGTHLIEFAVPKASMVSLRYELDLGKPSGKLNFEPVIAGALSLRLLMMARESVEALNRPSGPAGALLFQRWLELIGLTLLTEQPMGSEPQSRMGLHGPPPAALRRALEFMHSNAGAPILLADIASAVHVSVSSLTRMFARHLGHSPWALLRDLRLDRAREELRRGMGSIREIAAKWGFQSPSQFTQAYQRRFGELPSETQRRA